DQLAGRGQPRRRLVVVAAHLPTEDEETVVCGEVGRQRLAGVRAAHVERDTHLAEPVADPPRGTGLLVLDDEQVHRRLPATRGEATRASRCSSETWPHSASRPAGVRVMRVVRRPSVTSRATATYPSSSRLRRCLLSAESERPTSPPTRAKGSPRVGARSAQICSPCGSCTTGSKMERGMAPDWATCLGGKS